MYVTLLKLTCLYLSQFWFGWFNINVTVLSMGSNFSPGVYLPDRGKHNSLP